MRNKHAHTEPAFARQLQMALAGVKRPNSPTGGVLRSALGGAGGSGYFMDGEKPLLATFRDPKTNSNIGVPPNFSALDVAKRLRAIRNQSRPQPVQQPQALPMRPAAVRPAIKAPPKVYSSGPLNMMRSTNSIARSLMGRPKVASFTFADYMRKIANSGMGPGELAKLGELYKNKKAMYEKVIAKYQGYEEKVHGEVMAHIKHPNPQGFGKEFPNSAPPPPKSRSSGIPKSDSGPKSHWGGWSDSAGEDFYNRERERRRNAYTPPPRNSPPPRSSHTPPKEDHWSKFNRETDDIMRRHRESMNRMNSSFSSSYKSPKFDFDEPVRPTFKPSHLKGLGVAAAVGGAVGLGAMAWHNHHNKKKPAAKKPSIKPIKVKKAGLLATGLI